MMQVRFRLSFRQSLLQLAISALSMGFALRLFDTTIERISSVIVAILLIILLQQLLQPVLDWLAGRFGIPGIIAVSLLSSSLIVWLALFLLPGITLRHPIDGLFIGWIYAAGLTLAHWIIVSQSDDILLAEILRKTRKAANQDISGPGYLFMQLDGVSWPVLDWQLKAGNLPNISRLLDDEGYAVLSWRTQLPSTTPASQAGILLGSHSGIPAFRWHEKKSGVNIAANQPENAALIEKRLSSGKGLLADGGVSIGNLFSGDAPTNIMVMSKMSGDRSSIKAMQQYTSYFSSPLGFMRSFILALGEMVKEVYQARRQEAQDISPRVKRHGSYILLRAATNVVLRNLQTTIVIQNMVKGANSIYVDYLDYDEIAHHAGIARPESLAALSGLDQVVGLICKARAYAPRKYEIILVSDHGQSQGPTFRQLHDGKTLEDFVSEFTGGQTTEAPDESAEIKTSSRFLLAHGSQAKRATGAIARRISKSLAKTEQHDRHAANRETPANIAITGSGNLGNIWLNDIAGRATHEKINKKYPDLIDSLLRTKGIGFVLVKSEAVGYVCVSADGSLEFASGKVHGTDPLRVYPQDWQEDLLSLATKDNAPDIAVISSYDPEKGEVYAFEELVGNHGGIGGWQTEAVLLHPRRLKVPDTYLRDDAIHDSATLHRIFKHWMKTLR